jgi:hypothetical protein
LWRSGRPGHNPQRSRCLNPVFSASAVVRKKLALTLVSEKTGEERVYRILAGKAATKSKRKSGRKAA